MARVCPECGARFADEITTCPVEGSPTLLVQQDDLIGQTIDGRFKIIDLLGMGGMGAVYRAYQLSMDRHVALKVLRRDLAGDEQAVRRFFREARAVSKLASPHTITVFDFGQSSGGLLYIAMELLTGRSLRRVRDDDPRPMDAARAVRVVDQILDSLVEAHEVGVLHRDLKPDNVFVLEGRGSDDFVKVLDFGIAKVQGAGEGTSLTGTGMAFGTPTYMSPEQAQAKEVDARSDLYSVGVMLFELLAGKPPFEGDTPLALILKKVQEAPPSVYHVNPAVTVSGRMNDALSRLLATSVETRPASATEAKALLAWAMGDPDGARVPVGDVVVDRGSTLRVEAMRPVPGAGGPVAREVREPTGPTRVETGVTREPPLRRRARWVWIVGIALALILGAAGVLAMGGGTPVQPATATVDAAVQVAAPIPPEPPPPQPSTIPAAAATTAAAVAPAPAVLNAPAIEPPVAARRPEGTARRVPREAGGAKKPPEETAPAWMQKLKSGEGSVSGGLKLKRPGEE